MMTTHTPTERKPRALDLFCGAGGAARGLQLAGFHVTGVDIVRQPRYAGDVFIQADALTFPLDGYDLIWASPPCQFAARLGTHHRATHPNLIPATRERLLATGAPYIIENVADARMHLHNPVMLCGSMFGLRVWRHRYFECSSLTYVLTPKCDHSFAPIVVSGTPRRLNAAGKRAEPNAALCRVGLGTPWMTRVEMDQAIPPAYSEFLGRQVIEQLSNHSLAA